MSVEKFLYDRLGVRKEYPKTNLLALSVLIGISNAYFFRGLKINGSVPSEGPVLYIANHTGVSDAFGMFYAGKRVAKDKEENPTIGRIPRGVGKSTLFGIPESSEIRERTGKKDIFNSDNPLVQAFVRNVVGKLLYGAGVIPIRRGEADRQALYEMERSLIEYQQLVSIFIMESRSKSGRLEGIKNGAAVLVMRNEEIPFCAVGISRNPNVINIGTPTTFARIREERGRLRVPEVTLMLADGIVELLPPSIQEHWKQEGRETEFQELTGNKRSTKIQSTSHSVS